jgi:asparagine N-glycosylation enzyme membrane subunit Stt3
LTTVRGARGGWLAALLVALVAGSLSAIVRVAHEVRVAMGEGRWASMDPDTLYHARRLARAPEGGVAGRDRLLAYPSDLEAGGAAIPWPPYYDLLLRCSRPSTWLGETGRSEHVVDALDLEMHVASLSLLFSALTSALLAFGAARIGGTSAGLCAGLLHATTFGAVRYGALGNGDHHAFVSFLAALFFLFLGRALARVAGGTRSLAAPLAAGACAGALLGTWVASLLHVASAEIVLACAVASSPPERRPALARVVLALHLGALAALAPALLGDPWLAERPFALVVLSWFQPALLACVAILCLPWVLPAGLSTRARIVASLAWIGLLAALVLVPGSPLRAELAEAIEWAGASGEFMRWVNESQPLHSLAEIAKHLGGAIFVLPVACAWGIHELVRGRRIELAPWMGAALVFVPLAFVQKRFAEAASLPCALLGGVFLARAAESTPVLCEYALARTLALGLLAVLANPIVAATTLRAMPTLGTISETEERSLHRGKRELCRWLAEHAPPIGDPPEYAVLAQWDQGHLIEWAAGRPTVASNFGTYLGRESFTAPARFFLARDEEEAEAILDEHRARYVLLTCRFRNDLTAMVSLVHPGAEAEWLGRDDGSARWLGSVGARLLAFAGGPVVASEGDALSCLRLVHLSPAELVDEHAPGASGPVPIGWIYEHVLGARLEASALPGELLEVAQRLQYPGLSRELVWRSEARAGSDGHVRLRTPYCTEAANGDGVPVGSLRWRIGGRAGELVIPARSVETGASVKLP